MRAQSEVVGFALVFVLVIGLSSVLLVTGVPLIQEQQATEATTVMDRNFEQLHETVDRSYGSDGRQRFEMDLPDGLFVPATTQTVLTVTVGGAVAHEGQTTAFSYESSETADQIVYDAGLRVRSVEGGTSAHVVSRPTMSQLADPRTTSLLFYEYRIEEPETVAGDHPITYDLYPAAGADVRTTTIPGGPNRSVSIHVETPYPVAWKAYFETLADVADVEIDPASDTVSATFESEVDLVITSKPVVVEDRS